jgi:hypothetical protein
MRSAYLTAAAVVRFKPTASLGKSHIV